MIITDPRTTRCAIPTLVRVLLIDDHPIVRAGLRLVIEQDDRLRVVGESGRGSEVMRLVAELSPDIVVMDLNLIDSSGLQATRLVKQLFPAVRVMVVSTHRDDEYVLGAFDAGADGYLLKDSPPEELRDALLKVIAGERVIHPALIPALILKATRHAAAQPIEALSAREREVLELLAEGGTSKEIAVNLGLRPKTVENHRSRILDKLGAVNSAAAVRVAVAQGLIAAAGGHVAA